MRTLLLTSVLLTVPVAALDAVPVPHRKPKAVPVFVDLTGTSWEGQDGEFYVRFVFEPGGTLYYTYKNGEYRNATWKLDGERLYFEMNKQFREFRGTVKGDTITGESRNRPGMQWKTTLKRVPPPQ